MSYFTKYICFYKLDEDNTLLLNTLTSAMDIVDNSTYDKIQQMIKEKDQIACNRDDDLYKSLKSRGYIFDNQKEEQDCIYKMVCTIERMKNSIEPNEFVICPTVGCNLRCTYCFESDAQHKCFSLMSDEQLNTIFNYIKGYVAKYNEQKNSEKSVNKKLPNILLYGGEPLLKNNFHIVKKVLDFARQTKISVGIITNATTIDDDYCKLLNEYKNEIPSIQVTMDGNKSIHDKRRIRADGSGTFESICGGINKILGIGIIVSLRINVDAENIENLGELKKVFEKEDWLSNPLFSSYAAPVQCHDCKKRTCHFMTPSNVLSGLMEKGFYGNDTSFLKNVLSPVYGIAIGLFNTSGNEAKPWKPMYCESTRGAQYCFTPDGNIVACLSCAGNDDYRIGTFDENGVNIDEDRLKIWTDRDRFKIEKCKNCRFVFLCGGGCPVDALETNNDINKPICDDIENTIKVYVDHIKDKLLKSVEK